MDFYRQHLDLVNKPDDDDFAYVTFKNWYTQHQLLISYVLNTQIETVEYLELRYGDLNNYRVAIKMILSIYICKAHSQIQSLLN